MVAVLMTERDNERLEVGFTVMRLRSHRPFRVTFTPNDPQAVGGPAVYCACGALFFAGDDPSTIKECKLREVQW